MDKLEQAKAQLSHLLADYKTASLATMNSDESPQVSYVPIAVSEDRRFFLFVSELSQHTENLARCERASLMLIEDESSTHQLFARNRLTVEASVSKIERDAQGWEEASLIYRARFGKFFDQLASLRDFHMFCLRPASARIVVGFGAAFQVELPDWEQLTLLRGK